MPAPPHAESEARSPAESGRDDRRLDTSGELFEATNRIEPRMPGPPVHVHPTAEDRYTATYAAMPLGKYPDEIRATNPPNQSSGRWR